MRARIKKDRTDRGQMQTERRKLLKSTAFLGGCGLLATGIGAVFSRLAHAQHLADLDGGRHHYPHNDP